MPAAQSRIRVGHISLPLYAHPEGWRWAWKDPATGKWKYGTRRDRKEAVASATAKAAELAGHQDRLQTAIADPDTAMLLRRVLQMGLQHKDLDRIETTRALPDISLSEVTGKFLKAKEAARGESRRNIRSLTSHVNSLHRHFDQDPPIANITIEELEDWIATGGGTAPRTRKNRRDGAITIWRWARARKLLPDETTLAERTEQQHVTRKVPATYTPEELKAMLQACPVSHLEWLTIAAFSGLRFEELYQGDKHAEKDVLRWGDIDLKNNYIEVRSNVAKTGARRLVPIQPNLSKWLKHAIKAKGKKSPDEPVCESPTPHRKLPGSTKDTVTKILGRAIGGKWKENGLRHSFISYRATQIGLAKTAMEAGNSESEARKSYHDSMPIERANEWYALTPSEVFGSPKP